MNHDQLADRVAIRLEPHAFVPLKLSHEAQEIGISHYG